MGEDTVHHHSSSAEKIRLFRSLFRGREEVYPRRFESRKSGKSGYQPACANEWVHGLCDKRAVKCVDCPHRRFLPITDEVIRHHLSGHDETGKPFVMGLYPMLQDETCLLLVADFDKQGWQEDATAFLATCRRLNLPVALERSRSATAATYGSFLPNRSPRPWLERSPPICSPRPWNTAPISALTPTTDSFPTRTP